LSGRKFGLKKSELLEFLQRTLRLAEQTIQSNRAEDGLYHAYNLLKFENGRSLPIRRLYPMLEGQVAVLSSGLLSAQESLEVLTALRHSALYRANQHSYLLYPDRRLATFREKNNIPPKEIGRSRLLKYLVRDGNRMLVEKDVTGRFHFHPGFANARDLTAALDRVSLAGYASLVKAERHDILQLYETLFDHESFTGRSGTFFGYEGLGCIYWHMVSKLLLAVQETFFRALEADESPGLIAKLAEAYYHIRSGIGDYKTPAECGVFPMDPYSHTPAHAGARQPGLTGQVKEDILCRWGELGVQVHDGRIRFQPALLRRQEFLARGGAFDYVDTLGHRRSLRLPLNSLVFTYCQVPVTYQISYLNEVRTFWSKGGSHRAAGLCLDAETSDQIFARTGEVQRLVVTLTRSELATLER
jgi:hypothetical protein